MSEQNRVDVSRLMERVRFLELERQKAVSMAAQLRSENLSLRKALQSKNQQVRDDRLERVEKQVGDIELGLSRLTKQVGQVEFKLDEVLQRIGVPRRKSPEVDDRTFILPYE